MFYDQVFFPCAKKIWHIYIHNDMMPGIKDF